VLTPYENFHVRYGAFGDRRCYLIEFITDNNPAYVKPGLELAGDQGGSNSS